jgi:hypothetical protein
LWAILTALFYFGVIIFDSRSLDGAMTTGLIISVAIIDAIRLLKRMYNDRG